MSHASGDVAIVVTHYRSPDDLVRNLRSIAEHGGPRVAEVWVADSEAQPGVSEIVHDALPYAHYLPFKRNVGYAALVNMGAAASSTPYVFAMNADVALTPGCVDQLASELDRSPDVGVMAPRLSYPDGSAQHSTFAFYRPLTVLCRRTKLGTTTWGRRELERFLAAEPVQHACATGTPVDADWLLGAALMIRRTAFTEVGPLDEKYFMYFEDVDWCLRAWQAGWRCTYLPTATCVHSYARASARGGVLAALTSRLTRWHIRSAFRFFALHGTHVTRPVVATARSATAAGDQVVSAPATPAASSTQREGTAL